MLAIEILPKNKYRSQPSFWSKSQFQLLSFYSKRYLSNFHFEANMNLGCNTYLVNVVTLSTAINCHFGAKSLVNLKM